MQYTWLFIDGYLRSKFSILNSSGEEEEYPNLKIKKKEVAIKQG
jgi:hypothetical protein